MSMRTIVEQINEETEIYWKGWNAAVKAAADLAARHKGSAAAKRCVRGQQFKFLPDDAVAEIQAEERGEDIASDMIKQAILKLER